MRLDFLTRVLTSSFPDQVAKRFVFADGEVGLVYTMGHNSGRQPPAAVLLCVATFPPTQRPGLHDLGLVFTETPVGSAAEAAQLIEAFTLAEATTFRENCRP